jgi:hypothetical protein
LYTDSREWTGSAPTGADCGRPGNIYGTAKAVVPWAWNNVCDESISQLKVLHNYRRPGRKIPDAGSHRISRQPL